MREVKRARSGLAWHDLGRCHFQELSIKTLKRGLWTPYGERADHRKLLFGNPGPGNEMTYRGKLSGRKEAE